MMGGEKGEGEGSEGGGGRENKTSMYPPPFRVIIFKKRLEEQHRLPKVCA